MPPSTEPMVAIVANTNDKFVFAMERGICNTSGGMGKNELSAKARSIKTADPYGLSAKDVIQSDRLCISSMIQFAEVYE